jgi:hypothetical protein
MEIYSNGLAFIAKITVNDSCVIRGLHIGHLSVIDSKYVNIIDCQIDVMVI